MTSENLTPPKKKGEITLKEFLAELSNWFRYLLSKWITIVLIGLLGGALGLAYSFIKKPVYTATTTFVLEDEKSGGGGLGSLAGLASMAGIDLGGGGGGIFQGDNILELYKSRKMIEKTLLTTVEIDDKKQMLIDRYIEFNELRDKWSDKPALKDISFQEVDSKGRRGKFSRLQDSIIGAIVADINKKDLRVYKLDKKLSIIKADMSSNDELFAKAFNEQIVKNVSDFYIVTKTKKSSDNVAILQQKTDSVRNVMNGAIYSAAAVADATPNLNPTRQTQRIAPIQRSQFSAETNKAMLAELVKNLELSKIALRRETPLIQVVDEPVFPLEKQRVGKAKGIIVGGIVFGFLAIAWLLVRKILKE